MKEKFNFITKVFFLTRVIPAMVTIYPLWILVNLPIGSGLYKMVSPLPPAIKWEVLAAFMLALAQFNRYISIVFEKWLYSEVSFKMVITVLLWNDKRMDEQMKADIHAKLLRQFGIRTFTRVDELIIGEYEQRKILLHATRLIRIDREHCPVRVRYAREYSAARNLWGAAIVASAISSVLCIYGVCNHQMPLLWESLGLLCLTGSLLVISKKYLTFFAVRYALNFLEKYVYENQ